MLTGPKLTLGLGCESSDGSHGRNTLTTLSDDPRTLSYEAVIFFYPLVMMDVTRLQSVNRTGLGSGPAAVHKTR